MFKSRLSSGKVDNVGMYMISTESHIIDCINRSDRHHFLVEIKLQRQDGHTELSHSLASPVAITTFNVNASVAAQTSDSSMTLFSGDATVFYLPTADRVQDVVGLSSLSRKPFLLRATKDDISEHLACFFNENQHICLIYALLPMKQCYRNLFRTVRTSDSNALYGADNLESIPLVQALHDPKATQSSEIFLMRPSIDIILTLSLQEPEDLADHT